MGKATVILVLSLLAKITIAQSISTQIGARPAGMGYAASGLKDEWSLFNNPAGLSKILQINTAFAYEVKTQLKGANRMAAIFNCPLKSGTVSLGMFRFGDDLYNEQTLSLGFGHRLGIASLGAKANVVQYHAEGFGVARALTLDFGGITELGEHLFISAHITNLTQAYIGEDHEPLPTRLTAGFSYVVSRTFIIATELIKELDYPATWRTGMEYGFYERIFFRTGFNLHPNAAFFGLGISKKKIRVDYSVQYNHFTGVSHQASASYWLSTKEKK